MKIIAISNNIDKRGKNSQSACRKPNYHANCKYGKNCHKILSVKKKKIRFKVNFSILLKLGRATGRLANGGSGSYLPAARLTSAHQPPETRSTPLEPARRRLRLPTRSISALLSTLHTLFLYRTLLPFLCFVLCFVFILFLYVNSTFARLCFSYFAISFLVSSILLKLNFPFFIFLSRCLKFIRFYCGVSMGNLP